MSSKGLSTGLVRKVQIAVIQSVTRYGAELWWRNQKTWGQDHQKLINPQACTNTDKLRTTPVGVVVKKLDFRQPGCSITDSGATHWGNWRFQKTIPCETFCQDPFEMEMHTCNLGKKNNRIGTGFLCGKRKALDNGWLIQFKKGKG